MGIKEVSSVGGGSVSGAQNALGIIPSYPTELTKYRLALDKVRDGVSDMHILCVGDSTTAGVGSTLNSTAPYIGSWPYRLATLLNTPATPAVNGLAIPPSQLDSTADNRWVNNGWQKTGGGAANNAGWLALGTTTSLVFTPGVLADSYTLLVDRNTSTSLTITATGGTPVVVNTSTLPNSINKIVVTAASASVSNTVTITPANGNAIIHGIEPFLSTKKQILVGNAGVGTSSTANWCVNIGSPGSIDFIQGVAADLTIISLGINDIFLSTPAPTLTANLQAVINAAKISGDVMLMDMPPSSSGSFPAFEQLYVPALQALAAQNNIYYASIFNRFGGSYNAAFMSDNLHPNEQGYWDWAQYVSEILSAN